MKWREEGVEDVGGAGILGFGVLLFHLRGGVILGLWGEIGGAECDYCLRWKGIVLFLG